MEPKITVVNGQETTEGYRNEGKEVFGNLKRFFLNPTCNMGNLKEFLK